MKPIDAVLWLAGILVTSVAVAQQASSPVVNPASEVSTFPHMAETPAMKRIKAAESQIKADPRRIQAYNELAAAFVIRARESSDLSYYKDAESALAKGFSLDPNNFQLRKTRVTLLLGEQKFTQAEEQALELNKQTPDDVAVYGYLAQAAFALGNYDQAEKSAQWMLNMLPNNVPGLLIGADLRDVYGDPDGALEFLEQALAETPPTETEELARIENKIAAIDIKTGKKPAAEQALARAQKYFPGYRETSENLERLKTLQRGAVEDTSPPKSIPTASAVREASPSAVSPSEMTKADVESFAPIPDNLLTPKPTESARMINAAQARAKANPQNAQALADLGAAYFQRARETADVSDFDLADQSLRASLQLESAGFPAAEPLGILAEVYMGEHRFEDALSSAQNALALGSGDVSPFAIAGDAYTDMGDYDRAAQSYARLTPSDTLASPRDSYARDSRLSYLKFIAGDTAGAIRLMKTAVTEGSECQIPSENLAWLHYELGEYYTQAGDVTSADIAYRTALSIHPGDYRALASLARLRANNGRYDDAILLYQKAIAVVPMPMFVAELGDVYAKTGNQAEAEKQYLLVEYIGRLGQINQVLHNRDLAMFYADHDRKLPEALELARKEFEVRHDIYTWDALAWALYKNGKYEEAYQASQNALKFGTRDALLLYHSGVIATKLGKPEEARVKLSDALAISAHFHLIYADAARADLSSTTSADVSKVSLHHGR
jgi:tetratricopeptide (TPR) repeat protein